MILNILFEVVMHYVIIGGMTCLGHRDEFSMVNALVYVMHSGHDL